jgi:hypothetical protein
MVVASALPPTSRSDVPKEMAVVVMANLVVEGGALLMHEAEVTIR